MTAEVWSGLCVGGMMGVEGSKRVDCMGMNGVFMLKLRSQGVESQGEGRS